MKIKYLTCSKPQAFVICLALLIYAFSLFVKFGEFNAAPFREAQTALSTYYLIGQPITDIFNYQTPLLGPDWQIPFEVPIFQVIVSSFVNADLKYIIYCAKIVNLSFFALSIMIIKSLTKEVFKTTTDTFYLMAMLLFSPVFIVYATSVSIEFTALCLCLIMLYFFKHFCLEERFYWRVLYFSLALLCSILASAAKVTTWLAFGLPFLYIVWAYHKHGLKVYNTKYRLSILFSYVVINLVTFSLIIIWIQYSDEVKLGNPLSARFTSDALRSWNHFSIEQLQSLDFWLSILSKHLVTSGSIALLFIGIIILFQNKFIVDYSDTYFDKNDLLASFLLVLFYLIPTFVFANLFYRHEYYLISTNIFLLGSIYLLLRAFFKSSLESYIFKVGFTVFLLLISGSYLTLKKLYTVPRDTFAIDFLREQKPGPVVMSGFGFSSLIPFWIERRALMLFDHADTLTNEVFNSKVEKIEWTGVLTTIDDVPMVEDYLQTINYPYLEKKYLPYDLVYYSKYINVPTPHQSAGPCFERYSGFLMSHPNSVGKFTYDLRTLQFMYAKGTSLVYISLTDPCVTRVKL